MAEILTESFCERCGTRYTFQTAAPRRGRLARIRVATKGLRNYVLEDGSSLEDAFSEARNEEERAVSGQQLEAFHQTFNFCLSCRQYTCANCWNPAENRCLSCAPDLSREMMPAPLPDLVDLTAEPAVAERAALAALAWPEADLAREEPASEPEAAAPVEVVAAAVAAERVPVEAEPAPVEAEPAPVEAEPAPVEAEPAPVEAAVAAPAEVEVAAPAEVEVEPALVEPESVEPAAIAGPAGLVEAPPAPELAAAAQLTTAEPEAGMPPLAEAVVPEEVPAGPEVETAAAAAALAAVANEPEAVQEPEPTEPHARAAKAAAATTLLLGRFRPGQSLDAALDAYERGEPIPPEPAAAVAAAAAEPAVEPEHVATEAAVEPEPVAATAAAPEPAAEPEPVAAAAAAEAPTEPEPTPQEPAPTPAEPPAPAPRRDDRVELPVWTIVAPDAQTPSPAAPPAWPAVPPPAPGTPAWPSAAFAAPEPPSTVVRAREAMWAESSRDIVERAATGVQACVSCGLQLSATARFCRRCGTRQG